MTAICRFRHGDRVRVNCGQLKGLTGRICGSEKTNRSVLRLDEYGVLLAINNSALELVADIQATAPASYLELRVNQEGIRAVDANVESSVEVIADLGGELPLSSGLTLLQAPPRELLVSLASGMPTISPISLYGNRW